MEVTSFHGIAIGTSGDCPSCACPCGCDCTCDCHCGPGDDFNGEYASYALATATGRFTTNQQGVLNGNLYANVMHP